MEAEAFGTLAVELMRRILLKLDELFFWLKSSEFKHE